ncbi:glycosyltransferase [Niastella sp. OAS944]|uniref:glycosyltransferase family 2 protein n=1 Tax=Niastella sp. OAS944 TaxID=2664089 RepID=UPI00347628BE|nr:glycosyltransferase involved in cell wall biosynthesis [Chitinophagaceae bacterium OAS944]
MNYDKTKKNIYHLKPGVDPFFIVQLENKGLKAGWYWLSIEITETKDNIFAPKLFFNGGRGFNEQDVWNLPKISNNKIEGLLFFSSDVTELRFDPGTTRCSFTINEFRLRPLSKAKAFAIAVSDYKKRYFPNSSYLSFFGKLMAGSLQSKKFDFRQKLSDFIYNKESSTEPNAYKKWCTLYDTISQHDVEIIKSLANDLGYKPLFSIIMPVYNAPIPFLKKAIDSVINQAYPNWELCIADDKSTNPAVKHLLEKYQTKDQRIKVIYRETNGHISHASNSALELATGEYIALLDQDDELRPHSLYMVARAINENKDLKLIYSDEDKIDESGNRFDPYFKTDWNKDLFYGQNMVNHLAVYNLSLVNKIGGFRPGYEGSQDYDLALRCVEQIQAGQIHHIPHVLYHWRATEGSTARITSNKNYAYEAALNALNDHLKRTKQNATAISNINSSYRVKWAQPEPKPKVSIIIPTKDNLVVLSTCLESILQKTNYDNYEVLIIDNDSIEQPTYEYLKIIQNNNKRVNVLTYKNEFNFSAIVNYGVQQSNGQIVVLLNNDTEVINDDWLSELVSQCVRQEIGAVGAKLFYPNGQIQHAGIFLCEDPGNHIYMKRDKNDPGYYNKLNLVQNYSAVTAACLAVRKELFIKVGGFDEKNLKIAYNDVDFCLKVRELGYRNLFTPFAQLIHHESLTRGSDLSEVNFQRWREEYRFMATKWKSIISNDPFYNPNLSVTTLTTQFAFPPKIKYDWQ